MPKERLLSGMAHRVQRWAIYIDIEGSTTIYLNNERRFFQGVDALMSAACRIAAKVYPADPDRLSVHQTGGDGFIIVSEFSRQSPVAPIAIAVVLMRAVLAAGSVAKSGISQGEFSDVQSCFPTLHDCPADEHGRRRLGRGVLTTFPVMGTALINAHRLATRTPHGARLAVDRAMVQGVPQGVSISHEEADMIVVDWVHATLPAIDEIMLKAGLELPAPAELQHKLRAYVASAGSAVPEDWRQSTLSLNGCVP